MDGIDITTLTLAKSKHRSAERYLEKAIDSSDEKVRKSAGRQWILTGGTKNILDLIRKYEPFNNIGGILAENREIVAPVLQTAILGRDPFLYRNAYRIAYKHRFFDVIPSLLIAFLNHDKSELESESQVEGIFKFAEKYVRALDERKNRRLLYDHLLPEILAVLLSSLKDFHRNDPDLPIIVYLQLYSFMNENHGQIARILQQPSSALNTAVHKILLSKSDPFIFRFLTFCLDSVNPPPVALSAFAKRTDIPFIAFFLKNMKEPVSVSLKTNFTKQHIDWFDSISNLLHLLNEDAQSGLVILFQNIGLSDEELQRKLLDVFHNGKGKGRLDALAALTRFSGEQIDKLLWDAGEDNDPNVQVEALSSLGKRDMPNTSSRILQFADSPHEVVRETVQKLMPNLRFQRFLEIFDGLSESQRQSMFKLVKILDPQTTDELAQVLMMSEPKNQARALLCIEYGEMVPALEDSICGILSKGEPAVIRAKAAELLANGRRELSRSTLVQALHRDPSPEVRAAAKASLQKRPMRWETEKDTQNESE